MITVSGFTDEAGARLDTQLALLAELNENTMCPRMVDGKSIAAVTYDSFSKSVKPKLDSAGVCFSSIGSPIGKIALDDEQAYRKQLGQLAELAEIAVSMGCKYIRIFSFFVESGCDYEAAFPKVVSKLRGYLKVIEGTDIVLIHENEKRIFGDTPERALRLVRALDSSHFRLCYDASNYIQCGCDPWQAYLMTKQYTVYYHMKDCLNGIEVPLGEGSGRIADILTDLVKCGYDGYLTLEPHTAKYALLRHAVYLLPPVGKLAVLRRVYRAIDKAHGISPLSRVSRRQVYIWQHSNLVRLLEEAGYHG